jgi:hypothetical protein
MISLQKYANWIFCILQKKWKREKKYVRDRESEREREREREFIKEID